SESSPQWSSSQGSCVQTFDFARDRTNTEHLEVDANTAQEGFLILRLSNYPAWSVRVNRMPVSQGIPKRTDGLIAVPVAPGANHVRIDWTTTRDAWLGRSLSILAVLLLTALCAVERRRVRARLS